MTNKDVLAPDLVAAAREFIRSGTHAAPTDRKETSQ
jgi:hypothetical protein